MMKGLTKYLGLFYFELKSELNFKINYVFGCLSYAIHIIVFNALWDYILKLDNVAGYSKIQMIWYVVITEFIAYSVGRKNYVKVSEMIKSGDVANILTKPVSFIKYVFSLEATSVVNVVINIFCGAILGTIMAGHINLSVCQLGLFSVSAALGILVSVNIAVFIGMLAFFTEENKSFYLVISKAQLLLVLTPLELFPVWTQKLMSFLPMTYVVYPPGKIFVDFEMDNALQLIGCQIIALAIMMTLNYLINLKGVKKINVCGG